MSYAQGFNYDTSHWMAGEGGVVKTYSGPQGPFFKVAGNGRLSNGDVDSNSLYMTWEQFDAWVASVNKMRQGEQ